MANTTTNAPVELLRTWKVRSSAHGVELTLNGHTFELASSADALLFDLQRAVSGHQDVTVRGDTRGRT